MLMQEAAHLAPTLTTLSLCSECLQPGSVELQTHDSAWRSVNEQVLGIKWSLSEYLKMEHLRYQNHRQVVTKFKFHHVKHYCFDQACF